MKTTREGSRCNALAIKYWLVWLSVLSNTGQLAYAQQCDYYVAPSTSGGNDSNSGDISHPWLTAQKAFNTATAGKIVCFRAGTYGSRSTPGYSQTENTSGIAAAPIVFTNYPSEVAIIDGSTRINASYIVVKGTSQASGSCSAANPCGMVFEGSTDGATSSVDVCCASGSDPNYVTFDHVEIRHSTWHAGFYEEGCNNAITGSYVHDNGNTDRHTYNGIYWSTTPTGCTNGGLIANNLVENNYAMGIQLYDGGSSTSPAYVLVSGNTIVSNGNYGIALYGDNNVFANNILYDNADPMTNPQGELATGSNQIVDDNVTFDQAGGSRSGWYVLVTCPPSKCPTNNLEQNPLFVNASTKDWHLTSTSPAIGHTNACYVVYPQPFDKDGYKRCGLAAGAYEFH